MFAKRANRPGTWFLDLSVPIEAISLGNVGSFAQHSGW